MLVICPCLKGSLWLPQRKNRIHLAPVPLFCPEPGELPLTVFPGLCHPPRQLCVSVGDVKKQSNTLSVHQFWKIETGFIVHGFDVFSCSCKDLPLFCFDWQDLCCIFKQSGSSVAEGRDTANFYLSLWLSEVGCAARSGKLCSIFGTSLLWKGIP